MLVPFSLEPLPLISIHLVIEPNLELIRRGDLVIDPGPEGADKGGEIVVAQHPLELMVA
jgi:excinuclease UvrABC ATPase subunit